MFSGLEVDDLVPQARVLRLVGRPDFRLCHLAEGADIGLDEGSEERRISNDGAAVEVWVIPTDEERLIARHTQQVLSAAGASALAGVR